MNALLSTTETNPSSRTYDANFLAKSAKDADVLTDKAKSVPDLVALAGALDSLITIANALNSTVRMRERSGGLNLAGAELDDITDILIDRHVRVMERLSDTRPITKRQAEDRSCALLCWDLECDQDVTDVGLAAVRKHRPKRF